LRRRIAAVVNARVAAANRSGGERRVAGGGTLGYRCGTMTRTHARTTRAIIVIATSA
jgi:hypothetical protein